MTSRLKHVIKLFMFLFEWCTTVSILNQSQPQPEQTSKASLKSRSHKSVCSTITVLSIQVNILTEC